MRCAKCVLPDTTPSITFDKDGVCNYCQTYKKYEYRGEAELLKLLEPHRARKTKYNCIVPVSGGRDSSFTLLKMAKDYGMRVLAVNYENPFTEPQARKNVDNAVRALGIDLERFTLKNHIHERMYRNNLQAWAKRPSPAMIPLMCVACHTIWFDVLRRAWKHHIGLLVSGGNPFEYTSFKRELLNVSRDETQEQTFFKVAWGALKEYARNLAYLRVSFIPAMVKAYFFGDNYTLGTRLLTPRMTKLDLFHYLPWNEKEVLSRIKSELGWDYPAKFASTWRFDCRAALVKDCMYLNTIGMTEKDDFYAIMVREGQISREEAIQRLDRENRIFWDDVQRVLKETGIEDTSFVKPKPGVPTA